MRDVFTAVLEAGVYGSVIVLAVLLLRTLVKKTPGKWLCLLWLLAFLRLAMPFQIESSFSLQPDTIRFEQERGSVGTVQPSAPVQDIVPAVPDDAEFPEDVTVSFGDAVMPPVVSDSPVIQDTPVATVAPGISDHPAETHAVIDWLAVCGWVWLAGCVCFCGYGLLSYLRLKRRVREAVRCADGAWECAGLETAFILGFLRPRIYIPMGTSCGRDFILTHERGHIARGDHWWKLLGYLVLAVHWYNPLVWLAYLLLCRDMERACDERVVRHMTLDERKAYSTALLSCSTNRARIAACPVAFGEISVKGRIQNVLNYRKPGFWVICVAVIALVFVAVCLMTNPAQSDLSAYLRDIDSRLTAGVLNSDVAFTDLTTERELQELKSLLKNLRYAPDPVQEDTSGEDIWMYHWLKLECGEESDYILFTSDFTGVWAEIDGKRTPMYMVEDPETVKEFFDTAVLAVVNRPTSGEPFATVYEHWAWTQGIHLDAVQKASIQRRSPRVDNSVSTASGRFSLREFEEFLQILNALPETAFTSKTVDAKYSPNEFGRNGGLVVTIMDEVNQLKAWIRLENDAVELILTDQLGGKYCWVIEDETLLNYLKEMYVHPPIVTLWGWYGFDPVERCRVALELLKTQESYHVLTESDLEGAENVLNPWQEKEYWKDRDTRTVRVFPAGDYTTWWIKEENGIIYDKMEFDTYVSPDMQPHDWRQADDLGRDVLIPWFERFVWVDSQISLEGWEVTEDGETITISVSEEELRYLLTFAIDGTGSLTEIRRHSITVDGKSEPGTVTTTILQTMEPVDTTLVQDTLGQIMLQKCVDAMVELQNTEEFTVYSLERMDWRYKSNGYTRTEQGWNCYFSDPAWDYDLIRWLNYNGEQYIYDEVFDEQGNVIDTYRWQTDPNPEEHPFALPFPFELDWENVELVYQGTETKYGRDYIMLEYPAKRKIFAFRFGDGDRLQVLHVSDYFGGMPSNTVEFSIEAVNESEENLALRLYEEASGISPKPTVVRDDAFYEELFGRKPNSLSFSEWTNDLFDTLFIQPEEFVRQFTRLYTQDQPRAEEILAAMSMDAQSNAPYRFDGILEELRENPALDQAIVELLGERLQEWEVPSSIVVS